MWGAFNGGGSSAGIENSLGINGVPYEVYLRLSFMFVSLVSTVYNNWIKQESVSQRITWDIVKLLCKDKHDGDGISNTYSLMMLNTDLVLAKILAARLQTALPSLIGPEQCCAVKSRTIYFDIVAGVQQGDTLAPYLFIICLDYVLRTSIDNNRKNGFVLTKKRSRRYPAKTITDDDIALLANTPNQAETLLHSLERVAAGIGLHVNAHKTEFMCFNQKGDISILDGTSLKLVTNSPT